MKGRVVEDVVERAPFKPGPLSAGIPSEMEASRVYRVASNDSEESGRPRR